MAGASSPTEHLTISEPQNPPVNLSELHKFRRSKDFEDLNLRNGLSGQADRQKAAQTKGGLVYLFAANPYVPAVGG